MKYIGSSSDNKGDRPVQTHKCGFVTHVTVLVQKLNKWVCTSRDRPGTKTEIIIVTINVKVNPRDDTFTGISCSVNFFNFQKL
jgi:hypothetical protein